VIILVVKDNQVNENYLNHEDCTREVVEHFGSLVQIFNQNLNSWNVVYLHVFAVDDLVKGFQNLVFSLVVKPVKAHGNKVDRVRLEVDVIFVF